MMKISGLWAHWVIEQIVQLYKADLSQRGKEGNYINLLLQVPHGRQLSYQIIYY